MLCWSIRFCASRRPLMVFGSHIIETRSTLRPFLIGVNSTQKGQRSEEHTSELQSLMRTSYAVFCLKKKNSNHYFTKQMLYYDVHTVTNTQTRHNHDNAQ